MPPSFVQRMKNGSQRRNAMLHILTLSARVGLLRVLPARWYSDYLRRYVDYLHAHMPPDMASVEISFLMRGT